MIISCFALHNFRQLEKEEFINQDGILDDLMRQERVARNRRNTPKGNQNQPDGEVVRNAIKTISWKIFENNEFFHFYNVYTVRL